MYSVSVILAVKNEEKTIERTIQSILKQTLYDFELIIINNNSTDNTEAICKQYEKREPLIIEVVNLGEAEYLSAWNKGLKLARGQYIYFADTQVVFDNKMLKDNLKLAQEQKSDLVICGFDKEISNHKERTVTSLPNIPQLKSKKQFRKHYRNFHNFYPYTVKNKLYKRDYLLNNNMFFDEKSYEAEAIFNLAVYRNINSVAVNRRKLLSFCELKSEDRTTSSFENDIKRAFILEKMLEEWQMLNTFEDVIFDEYLSVINTELTAIVKNKKKSSKEECNQEIVLILNNQYVKEFVSNYEDIMIQNPFKRSLFKSLNKNDYNQIANQIILNNKVLDGQNKAKTFLRKIF